MYFNKPIPNNTEFICREKNMIIYIGSIFFYFKDFWLNRTDNSFLLILALTQERAVFFSSTYKKEKKSTEFWKFSIKKTNKLFLNKINFKNSSYILKCLLRFPHQFFLIHHVKFISSLNFRSTSSFFCSLNQWLWITIFRHLVIRSPAKIALGGTEKIWHLLGFILFKSQKTHKNFVRINNKTIETTCMSCYITPTQPRILIIHSLVWFRFVLWHITHCRLFMANPFLYI